MSSSLAMSPTTSTRRRRRSISQEHYDEARKTRRTSLNLSVPATINSTTVATVEKAVSRRRRTTCISRNNNSSLSSIPGTESENPFTEEDRGNDEGAKENANDPQLIRSPGPTPYYKVARERGNISPIQTRSAAKKKREEGHRPPLGPAVTVQATKGGCGMMLTFSPPDPKKIDAMEKEQECNFRKRVEKNRKQGQLLEFSPRSGRPLTNLDDRKDCDDESVDDTTPDDDPENFSEGETTPKISCFSLGGKTQKEPGSFNADINTPEKLEKEEVQEESTEAGELDEGNSSTPPPKQKSCIKRARFEIDDEKWKKEVHELERLLDCVNSEKMEIEKKVLSIEHAKAEAENQAIFFKTAKEELENRIIELGREKAELLEQLSDFEKQIQKLDLENKKVEIELKDKNKAADTLADLEAEQEKLKILVDEYKVSILSIEEDLNDAVQELESKVKENDELKQKLEDIEMKFGILKQENITLSESVGAKEQDIKKITLLQSELEENKTLIGKLIKQIDDAQSDRELMALDASQKQAELDSALNEMMQELDRLEQEKNNLTKDQEHLLDQLKRAEADKDELSLDVKELHKQIASKSDQIFDMSQELDQAIKESEETKRQLVEFQAIQEQYDSERDDKDKQIIHLTQKVQDQEHKIEEQAQAFEEQLKDSSEKDNKISSLEMEIKRMQEFMECFTERETGMLNKLVACDQVRRELQNRVMQLSGNIRVFVRVRPVLESDIQEETNNMKHGIGAKGKNEEKDKDQAFSPFSYPGLYDQRENKITQVHSSADDITKKIIVATEPHKDRGGLTHRPKTFKFGFDNVFTPEEDQQAIWEATSPLVQSAVDGYNVTIFAYGQTGSGKTHTMLGNDSDPGIIERSVNKLFHAKKEIGEMTRGESKIVISIELVEVYNEQVRDLLASGEESGKKIKLTHEGQKDVVKVETQKENEVRQILNLAQNRRCVKATASNEHSSRSHMLFTLYFSVTDKEGVSREGKLNICDLAGSERLSKSGANIVGGSLLDETKNINKSLATLSNVIAALQNGDRHVPFRESQLTMLLKDSLGGNSKTLAIVCCSPVASSFSESVSSLKFADKVNKVELKAVANFSC